MTSTTETAADSGASRKRTPETTAPTSPLTAPKTPTKSATVRKLLGRAKGATAAEISEPTGWQPHSVRAYLTGLRKKGMTIVREQRKTGESAYRIGEATTPSSATTATSVELRDDAVADDQAGAGAPTEATA